MVKSVLGLLRCVTFVTPNPSPPMSWCKWQIIKDKGTLANTFLSRTLGFREQSLGQSWKPYIEYIESEKGPQWRIIIFIIFLGSNPLRDFLSGLNDSCIWPCCPRPLGGSHKPARTGTHRKRRRLGELGWWARCWLVHEWKDQVVCFPAVFSLVNQEGLVFADPLWW